MRIVVTGGAGFIGSHLTDRLLREGHEVAVIDDLSSGRREQVSDQARFHELSVASQAVAQVIAEERPEVVFHLAAQIDVRKSVSDPVQDAEINVLGTVQLLTAAARAGVDRFVFMSSGGALYGDTEVIPTPESHPWRPASPYGAAKAAGEAYLAAFATSFGLQAAVLRPGNVYGPRQDPHGESGVIAIFAHLLLAGQAPVINGDGRQTRDYVFVEDLVEAAIRIIRGPLGQYNIGTGRETTVTEVAEELGRAVSELRPGSGPAPAPLFGPARDGEQLRSCLDCSLAASELGWSPQVALPEGLQSTIAYFVERGPDYL
ncbi:MAG TPA: NAD-dependent epimerase/dehydratase family protein [Candidatus Dormibacteraeota bacterium]|nr:NAD-dependent epimerase/dehydratase family protein [Candidatus Dormibacteraeota bacterium]